MFLSRFRNWFTVFVLYLVLDLFVVGSRESLFHYSAGVFWTSIFLSFLFFYFLENVRKILPETLSKIYLCGVATVLAFLIISSIFAYSEFGEYITYSKLQFSLNNSEYLWIFIKTYLLNWTFFVFLGLIILIYYLWNSKHKKYSKKWRFYLKAVVSLILYLVILNQLQFESKNKRMTMDASLAVSIKALNSVIKHSGLHEGNRLSLAPTAPKDKINILVILNESWGKKAFDNCPADTLTMPKLYKRVSEKPDNFIYFPNCFANSSSTDVSFPSVITGVGPWEPNAKLHNQPLIWDWAKASGYRTYLFSSQALNWAGFYDFFGSNLPDYFLPAEKTNLPDEFESGLDDMRNADLITENLNLSANKENFFAFYFTNALHAPFMQKSTMIEQMPENLSKYQNAAYILDSALSKLFNYLEKTGLINNTIVILSGDHGDTDSIFHRPLNRLYCFYDEIMNVPFLVYVPDILKEKEPEYYNNLISNRSQIVSNIDILPTIAEICGAKDNNIEIFKKLLGISLFERISPDRYTISLNTNDARQWEYEGFGIYKTNERFVYSNIEGAKCFNALQDKLQIKNIWDEVTCTEKNNFLNIIDTTFHLKRMFKEN